MISVTLFLNLSVYYLYVYVGVLFWCFFSSFPTPGRTAFRSTWSSWLSCSCWARQPSRPSPTTASTPPPGCTPPPSAMSMHSASEAATGRSWRMRTRITSVRCMTGVRWVTQVKILEWTFKQILVFWSFECVSLSLYCRHAQGKRGQCWNLMLRCPPRSPSSTWLCLILGTGTRSLDSKLARSASTVNQAGGNRSNLIGKKSHGHFLHAGRKLHSRLNLMQHIYKLIYLNQCSAI